VTVGPRLNLIVIRGEEPDRLVQFYEAVGLRFIMEKHGRGPKHYAAVIGDIVLEIYPSRSAADHTTGARLGFRVDSVRGVIEGLRDQGLLNVHGHDHSAGRAILKDPAGHVVELAER
jgi:lactoylglutathione lyase